MVKTVRISTLDTGTGLVHAGTCAGTVDAGTDATCTVDTGTTATGVTCLAAERKQK